MTTIESERNNNRCPQCNGRTTQDHKGRQWVRHADRIQVGVDDDDNPVYCTYGREFNRV